ncbi:MAG: DMT family transporter, partial [Chloroflexota bacterium]
MLRSRVQVGVVMVLVSAASFGTIPILAKFAYAEGMTPLQVLTFRFLIAAVGLTAIAIAAGQGPSVVGWARALPLFAVGLFFYAGMAGTFFGALTLLPASLAELIAYLYPALVAVGAWAFFGGEMDRRIVVALTASFAGLALLVGAIELRGGVALVLAFASPVLYSGYILASARLT